MATVKVMAFVFVIAVLVIGIIIPVVTVQGLTKEKIEEMLRTMKAQRGELYGPSNELEGLTQSQKLLAIQKEKEELEEKYGTTDEELEEWKEMTPEQKVAKGYGLTWEEEIIYLTNKYQGTNYTTYREMAMGELERAYQEQEYFELYGEWMPPR